MLLLVYTLMTPLKYRRSQSQDLRNHGESPHHPTHNYTTMAEDVEEFIQFHHLRSPTLIGHSMFVFLDYDHRHLKLMAAVRQGCKGCHDGCSPASYFHRGVGLC